MIAPRIDSSDREERERFIRERFHCKAPACGGCGSCRLPGHRSAMEFFAGYIDGRVEFAALAQKIWTAQ